MHFNIWGAFFLYMEVIEFIKYFEKWAPPGAAWDKDNVGLQIGSPKTKITSILLALELNKKVIKEALNKNCNFIFTHHPFIFKPIKNLNFSSDEKSQIIKELIKNDITVYSAHTNLDFTKGGVSFKLAEMLNLKNIKFLELEEENQYKIAVYVPNKSLDSVADSMFENGAGKIGEYENCSFRSLGEGTFKGSELSNPNVGIKNNFEKVQETRLEVLVDKWNLNKVLNAMINAHPYEEPVYDVYVLKNKNINYGFGAIGELEKSMNESEFLGHVCKSLKTQNLRLTKGKSSKITKVAVCGGSGSDLLFSAISQQADAFITADVKYHTFQDAEEKILLVDAGHYETEIHSLDEVKKRIDKFVRENKYNIKVYKYSKSTNPISFYNYTGVK